jgi:hypothetical protein
VAILAAAQTRAAAFECPVAHVRADNSSIKETPAQIAQLSKELEADQSGNTAIDTVAELKRRYPVAPFGEIVNYMIAAYCPIIAKNASLSDEEKEARLENYSQQITAVEVQ